MITKYITTHMNGVIHTTKQHNTAASVRGVITEVTEDPARHDLHILRIMFPVDDPTMWDMTPMAEEQFRETQRETLSANHWSHAHQVYDVLTWMDYYHNEQYHDLMEDVPDGVGYRHGEWTNSEDPTQDEWSMWLADAIEHTGLVEWEDGEPFTVATMITEDGA